MEIIDNRQDTPNEGVVQQVLTTDHFSAPTSHFLMLAVLWSSCSTRRSLQPTPVAQVVQLIQDGTLMWIVARRFAVSVGVVSRPWRCYQETGKYIRKHWGGCRRAATQQQHCYYCFCARWINKNPAICHWCPVLFTDESLFTLADVTGSRDTVENLLLPATSSSWTGLAVGQ